MDLGGVTLWVAEASHELAEAWAERVDIVEMGDVRRVQRERRVVQLALRRTAVAVQLGVAPGDVRLAGGRDVPLSIPSAPTVSLSASHYDDITVIAIGNVPTIGVDVEPLFEPDWAAALDAVLAPTELEALLSLDREEQPRAYFTAWTLKEAVMKALGEGLSNRDPSTIEVTLPPAAPQLRSLDGCAPTSPWTLTTTELLDCVVAVAVRGSRDLSLDVRRWPLDLPSSLR